jgi:type II secretory pathway component PulK
MPKKSHLFIALLAILISSSFAAAASQWSSSAISTGTINVSNTFGIVPPTEALSELHSHLDALDLPKGIERSLLAKLEATLRILSDDTEINDTAAIQILQAFINEVESLKGKMLTEGQANSLIAKAQEIIDSISG